jgi:hypothetical protein
VSRGLLGIELDVPFALGPLRIVELALGFPAVRFPVDLSGGVARFRHKRGALVRVLVEVSPAALGASVAPRLRGIFAESSPDVVVAHVESGLFAGLSSGAAALAFDVLVAPADGDVRLPSSAPAASAPRAAAGDGVARARGGDVAVR